MTVELYEHQQTAVDAMHNGCILRGDVGTGKTITSLYYYYTKVCKGVVGDQGSMRDAKDLVVITTAKKRDSLDWEEDAALLGVFKNKEDNPAHVSITVDSWNNINKYEGIKDAFFIFDEQRLVGAGAWTKSFIEIAKHNEWILLSATPGDTWLDYIPVFIANGFYKNRTEFKRNHVVYNNYSKFPKVERYTGAGLLIRHRNSILVEMPYHRHTIRHEQDVEVQYDKELFDRVLEDRWHVYEERPLRDVAELFSVMRKVVNSDTSRLSAISQLMAKHPRLIVFYNFNYELEMLRTLGVGSSSPSGTEKSTSAEKQTSPKHNGIDSSETNSNISVLPSPAYKAKTKNFTRSTECPGHWTDDIGNGEFYLECKDGVCWVPDEASEDGGSWEVCGDTWFCETGDCLDGFMSIRDGRYVEAVEGSSEAHKADLSASDISLAEWNGHKHEQVPESDKWIYLVQYVAGAEGWNCISTNAVAFWSQTYSYKNFHQSKGRIDRLNTPFIDLYYYMLKSLSMIDKAVAKSIVEKKSFNETDFGKKMLMKKAAEAGLADLDDLFEKEAS